MFLFDPGRVRSDDRPGGDSVTAVGVSGTGAGTHLTASPGRHADYDVAHIDSEFAAQTSDHDPQTVRVKP
ncbi:hypothetical protein ABZ619_08290 [Streptomyces sp. NPDC007851]|uniref:hypothetical protein n=1 Tax=Streptomyces sp. NPDC007851 TaxID=3155008 RepID=UPI0033F2466A